MDRAYQPGTVSENGDYTDTEVYSSDDELMANPSGSRTPLGPESFAQALQSAPSHILRARKIEDIPHELLQGIFYLKCFQATTQTSSSNRRWTLNPSYKGGTNRRFLMMS